MAVLVALQASLLGANADQSGRTASTKVGFDDELEALRLGRTSVEDSLIVEAHPARSSDETGIHAPRDTMLTGRAIGLQGVDHDKTRLPEWRRVDVHLLQAVRRDIIEGDPSPVDGDLEVWVREKPRPDHLASFFRRHVDAVRSRGANLGAMPFDAISCIHQRDVEGRGGPAAD